MKSPQRYDLIPLSCVNKEVLNFNRQLEKRMKIYNNAKTFKTKLDRKHFTMQGQHMNLFGKELICCKLSTMINEILIKKQSSMICMQWRDVNSEEPDRNIATVENMDESCENLDLNKSDESSKITLTTKRSKRKVALRDADFLRT
jgi:hypothetical protein